MRKVFYSDSLKNEVLDESGLLTLEQVKERFHANDFQEVSLNATEAIRIVNGLAVKFDFAAEELSTRTARKDARKASKQAARTALNMTKPQFKDFLAGLKSALEDGDDN